MANLKNNTEIKIVTGPDGMTWGDSSGRLGYIVDAAGNPVSGYIVEVTDHVYAVGTDEPRHILDPERYVAVGFDITVSDTIEAVRFFRGRRVILEGIVDRSDQIE